MFKKLLRRLPDVQYNTTYHTIPYLTVPKLWISQAPKLEAATLAGASVNFTDSAETFLVSKHGEPDFPNFFLDLDFQDSENETPNKRIK